MKPLLIHVATVARSFHYFSLDGQIGYMRERGFDVAVLAREEASLRSFSKKGAVRAIGVDMQRAISPLSDVKAIVSVWRTFRNEKPTIVHAHTPKGGLIGMLCATMAGIKIKVYHLHGLPHLASKGLVRLLLYSAEYVSCRLAQRVYCVSESILESAVTCGVCPREKTRILCFGSINGVDGEGRFNPRLHDSLALRKKFSIPLDAFVIGFVGRVVKDKGIMELVDAWRQLSARFKNLYLVIVGPFEEKNAIPPEVASVLREDARVRCLGEVEDAAPYYALMDVLALPSYREGFGLAAIEASAMEVPVVATRIPGCVDAVADGYTGTLVPPGDAPGLAEAIGRYLDDGDLRRRHGGQGRSRVLSKFIPKDIWQAQYEEYRSLMGSALPQR